MATFVAVNPVKYVTLLRAAENRAGCGAPLKKRKARAPKRKPARAGASEPLSGLIRSVAARLKRAKLVFAHGTTDPVAEAAFMVGETLGIHPDHVEARAGMTVTAAQQKKIAALVERRIRTRKPAAYLLKRIYMRGVPFYIDERAIVPRSYLGEILDSELFAGESFSLLRDADCGRQCARSLHRIGMSRDSRRDAISEGEGRRRRACQRMRIEVARKNVADIV